MPDEMLEGILMGFALQRDRVNGDEMPGGMPETELVFVNNPAEADMEDGEDLAVNEERENIDVGHHDQDGSEDEEEEDGDGDEEEEEAVVSCHLFFVRVHSHSKPVPAFADPCLAKHHVPLLWIVEQCR